MGNGDPFIGNNGNGETHDRKLLLIPTAINGVDIALEAIVPVVKVRNDQIETFGHGLADGVDVVRVAHEDEIISADGADKSLRAGEFSHHIGEDAARHDEDFISTAIAIPVVEGLEIVDIDVGEREGLPALDPGSGFKQNSGVAREASEGIGIEQTSQAAEA